MKCDNQNPEVCKLPFYFIVMTFDASLKLEQLDLVFVKPRKYPYRHLMPC